MIASAIAGAERTGVYPGSFNPPTLAHVAIAEAAVDQHRLRRVDLVISRVALAKEDVTLPSFDDRVAVLHDVVAEHDFLGVAVTDRQLLVDIAHGYDVLVLGADKWHQIQDPIFYDDDPARRDAAMAALPQLAIAPRPPLEIPPELLLPLDHAVGEISSTAARGGMRDWMHPRARDYDTATGAWTDQERYIRDHLDR